MSRVVADGVDRRTLISAGLVVVGAVAIRVPGAVRDSFWQDEVSSARIMSVSSPAGALRQVARGEATPPLWYMLGWLAHQAGITPGGYRWVSVLAGAAAAGLIVLFARRILPLWASVLAGMFAALAWELVMHGRELRAYAVFSLLAVLFALVLRPLLDRSSRWAMPALALLVAAGTMTSYFFGLTVIAGVAWLWLEPSVRPFARRATIAIACGLAPLALWSPALVHQYRAQRFAWIGPFSLRRLVDTPWLLFAHHVPTDGVLRDAAPALTVCALLAGTVVLARRSPEGRLCALLFLGPFGLATLAWAAGAHVFLARNLVGVAPFAGVALAALCARVPQPVAFAVGVAAAALLAFGSIRAEATPPAPYSRVARALVAEGWQPADPVVLLGEFFSFRSPLEWYLPGRPRLTLGLPAAGGTCRRIYVVAQGPNNLRRIEGSPLLLQSSQVGGVLVGRLGADRLPSLGGATSLVATSARPPCVRLVPETGLVSALRQLRIAG